MKKGNVVEFTKLSTQQLVTRPALSAPMSDELKTAIQELINRMRIGQIGQPR